MSSSRFIVLMFFVVVIAGAFETASAQMGPQASPETIAAAAAAGTPVPKGPIEPNWESIEKNYKVPDWFRDGKFGIFLHWGVYAVPARQSEWYVKHMYGNEGIAKWHAEKFGPQEKFGYKNFIPMFTCEKYDPDAWAELFKRSGAKYVIPTAEHHDGFSLWDSALNKFCAAKMGPKRDLIADLARACRKQGLKFGVSNHSMEHFTFINPLKDLKTDLYDPNWAEFYSVADRSETACQKFLEIWIAKNFELIDKFQPDMLWFDNGINSRSLDPLKLKVAAYYYNRAKEWGREVTLCTKDEAYLAGSVKDYERQGRGPTTLQPEVWQVDDSVHQRWGYLADAQYCTVESIVYRLVENVSKNGNLLMNFAPKADGTIPDEQQKLLLGIGKWIEVNGEAIYGTRPWNKFGEGVYPLPKGQYYTGKDIRFTTKGDTLFAIFMAWPEDEAVITSLAAGTAPAGKIESVTLLGHKGELIFTQDETGLKVTMPSERPCDYAYTLKIAGLKLKE